jgi:hypothetical protein
LTIKGSEGYRNANNKEQHTRHTKTDQETEILTKFKQGGFSAAL